MKPSINPNRAKNAYASECDVEWIAVQNKYISYNSRSFGANN